MVAACALLDEDALAKLIAPYKRLGRAEALKEQLNFAVLINVLRRDQQGCRQQFETLFVENPVAIELIGQTGIEHGQDGAALAQQAGNTGQERRQRVGVQVVEEIPQQDGVDAVGRLRQIGLQEALGSRTRGFRWCYG